MSFFNKYFYKNKKSKLCFEDRIAVLNIYFLYWREYMHARTPFPYIITVHAPLIANLIIYNRVLVPNNYKS